jgi:hypothetical protein
MESTGGDACRNTSSLMVADTNKDELNPLQVVAPTGDAGGNTIPPSGNEEAPEKENSGKETTEGNDCTDLEAVKKEDAADSSSEKTTEVNVSECSDDKKSDNGTLTVVSGENASDDGIPSEDRRSTQASGFIQILALLRKNLLTKYRSPTATFFELFSPVLMTLVLAAAYTVTEITFKEAQMYSEISFDVPGPWLDLIQRSTDLFTATEEAGSGSRRKLRREPNLMEFQIEDKGDPVGWTGMFDALQDKIRRKMMGHVVAESRAHTRKLFHDDNGEEEDDGEDDFAEVFKLLDEANKEVSILVVFFHFVSFVHRSHLSPRSDFFATAESHTGPFLRPVRGNILRSVHLDRCRQSSACFFRLILWKTVGQSAHFGYHSSFSQQRRDEVILELLE